MASLTYEDYKNRLKIQELLIDAGYTLNKRDGLRYPSYVRLDNEGRRIRGDKFILTANGQCCFQPPVQKVFNVISFIKEHPDFFQDYQPGMDKDRLVNLVCCRLLNEPIEERESKILEPQRLQQPFNIDKYSVIRIHADDRDSHKPFYPYFKNRGIDLRTQYAFRHYFMLAARGADNGTIYKNLSFPMRIPGNSDIVGFEERGLKRQDGTSYKGMAAGSNASEGMWIASPNNVRLANAKYVFVFESAYDAMAFYQILTSNESQLDQKDKASLKSSVYVSTGGSPTYGQISGLIKSAPHAAFHLGFDNDMAGQQFEKNFRDIAFKQSPVHPDNVPEDMRPFIDSFKDRIKDTDTLAKIDGDQYDTLPRDLKDIYLKYDTAREEALDAHYSPFLCKEDKEDAFNKMHDAFGNFKEVLFGKLNIKDGQDLGGVKIVRELPSEGYKDFNEELIGENAKRQEQQQEEVETPHYHR